MPGLFLALKIATQGTPTAAARCIGPLSCPKKRSARLSNAALTLGEAEPHRFHFGPYHFAATNPLRSFSSVAPTRARPTPG
jgi:hypothetical protein